MSAVFGLSISLCLIAQSLKYRPHVNRTPLKNTTKHLICFLAVCLPLKNLAQNRDIPIGAWREHPGYAKITAGLPVADKIYGLSPDGIFSFSPTDGEIKTFTKAEGLTGGTYSSFALAPSGHLLMGYSNGKLDRFDGQKNTSAPGLSAAPFPDKAVSHILPIGSEAYLSAGFGLALIDIKTMKIKETYSGIGQNGSSLKAYKSVLLRDSLFVASSQGIRVVAASPLINKMDFANWSFLPSITRTSIKLMDSDGQNLYFIDDSQTYLYSYGPGGSKKIPLPELPRFHSLDFVAGKLYIGVDRGVLIYSGGGFATLTGAYLFAPRQCFERKGEVWAADEKFGLLNLAKLNELPAAPQGPFVRAPRKFIAAGAALYAVPGGFAEDGAPVSSQEGFSAFEAGVWKNHSADNSARQASLIPDILGFSALATASGVDYWASFGQGLWTWDKTKGSLEQEKKALFTPAADGKTYLADIKTDKNGTLWAVNHAPKNQTDILYSLDKTGAWKTHAWGNRAGPYPLEVQFDALGNKWLRLNPEKGGGLLAFDDKGRFFKIDESERGGGLRSGKVYSMAFDKSNSLWLGTADGLARIDYPEYIPQEQKATAIVPVFENSRLMAFQKITAIAIDGGDRKWFGTEQGAWLYNKDCSQLLLNFNASNSPLPGNHILAIGISPETGEVFFSTPEGIASYRAGATEASGVFEKIKIFPNPVRPDFAGTLAISGLAENSEVKITDMGGMVICKTVAEGGTALWNLQGYGGKRAKSGVYLVFCSDKEGNEGLVGKILLL